MQSFKDKLNRTWTVEVNYLVIDRVFRAENFNLLHLLDPKGGEQLAADPLKHLRILYQVILPKVGAIAVTFEDFVAALDGDCAEAAGDALREGLINFSQSRLRPAMRKLVEKSNQIRDQAMARATAAIETINVNQILDRATASSPQAPYVTAGPAYSASASTPPESSD